MCITPLSALENRQNKTKKKCIWIKADDRIIAVSKCMLLLQQLCSRQKKMVYFLEGLMTAIYIIYLVAVARTFMCLSSINVLRQCLRSLGWHCNLESITE